MTRARVRALLRTHAFFATVFVLGLLLRALAQFAYNPALIYFDSFTYLVDVGNLDPTAAQPIGYPLFLRPVLAVGGVMGAVGVQHLIGLAMAVVIYVLLLRRGVRRWLAALAAVPVLLDAYQVQIEQNIMSDVLFEALLLAAVVALAWRPRPGLVAASVSGLVLGCAVAVRLVGEVTIIPAVLFIVCAAAGRRRALGAVLALAAFAVPVGSYALYFHHRTGTYALSATGDRALYARVAVIADCATLRLPADEQQLCPAVPVAVRKLQGVDFYANDPTSPINNVVAPPGVSPNALVKDFAYRVIEQQPGAFAGAVLGDAAKLFAFSRTTSPGDVPVSRWQFQTSYPYYPGWDTDQLLAPWSAAPTTNTVLAAILRGYQLGGGYVPGPVFALCIVLALAGGLSALRRPRLRLPSPRRGGRGQPRAPTGRPGHLDQAGEAGLVPGAPATTDNGDHITMASTADPSGQAAPAAPRPSAPPGLAAAGVAFMLLGCTILIAADIFEFSWRYQLPAVVLLPAGGALGLTALLARRRPKRPLMAPFPDAVDAAALAAFAPGDAAAAGADERGADGVASLAADCAGSRGAPCAIVIAAYNEAEAIGGVLERMPRSCLGMDVEVLVVVDGATDGTAEAVAEVMTRQPHVRMCAVPVNRGQGAALRLGYQLAHRRGARYIVTTDADGQYDIDELPRLLAPLVEGRADFVTGSRNLGRHETQDRVRRAGSYVFAWIVSAMTRQRVTDTSFGLRAMRADVPVSVRLAQPQYQSSELMISVLAAGHRLAEVPMTMRERTGGRTKKGNNLVYGSRYARVVLGTWLRERRTAAWAGRRAAAHAAAGAGELVAAPAGGGAHGRRADVTPQEVAPRPDRSAPERAAAADRGTPVRRTAHT